MIFTGALLALVSAVVKLKIDPKAVETQDARVLDLLKEALKSPVANVLIVLGFVLVLLERGLITISASAG